MSTANETRVKDSAGNNGRYVSEENERKLVEAARTDPHAFGKLFTLHYDRIFRYLLHRTASVHLAQDLTSTTFFRAMKALWRFDWRGISLAAWLCRIASNEANKYFRKHGSYSFEPIGTSHNTLPEDGTEADRAMLRAEKELGENALFLRMHREISRLKPKYQDVIVLRYFENKKISEISEILGKSEGTIKSLLHRAQKQLHATLEAAYAQHVSES